MRDVPRQILLPVVLSFACVAGPVAAAPSPALPLQVIDVLGRVTGPGGRGLEDVRIVLDGFPEVSATTDVSGSYTLSVPLAPLGDPVRKAVTVRLVARRPGWAFTLRNGQGALAIELRLQTRSDPARCRVRSNLLNPVDAVAAAIQRGDRSAVVASADFVGEEGVPPNSRVSLRSEAVTIVGEPSEPEMTLAAGGRDKERMPAMRPRGEAARDGAAHERSGNPAVARADTVRGVSARELKGLPLIPRQGARPPTTRRDRPQVTQEWRDSTVVRGPSSGADGPASRPRIRRIEAQTAPRDSAGTPVPGSIKLPGPGVTQTDASLIRRIEALPGGPDRPEVPLRADDVLARDGECACRIRGTVEIHPDHLLTRRLEVIVALREMPAVRDTVQLFMGSPRAFELAPIRCGTWHIEVDVVARLGFSIVSADGRSPVECREGGLRQLRVVLDPN